jgi:DNA-binding NtrC family response regulator
LIDGAELKCASAQAEGLRLVADDRWDAIILDEDFSGAGTELLGRLSANAPRVPVVLLTAEPSMASTLSAIRQGAHDVIAKPPSAARLADVLGPLRKAGRTRRLPECVSETAIVGTSPGMATVYRTVARAVASDATILLLGESGTGKELIARTLHSQSGRAGGPFVAINCAAIPENLLESELFGHEKGSFTGAIARRVGRFERASGGTLFLDEVGDMSLALQAKILRALQEREIERVGGGDPVPFDVRVVAATNQDLAAAVAAGAFREDLFYRLAVISLHLPPLRERGDDLDRLVEHFTAYYAARHGRPLRAIAETTIDALRQRSWPGNVRQLRNALERAVVMSSGTTLLPDHLPSPTAHGPHQPATHGLVFASGTLAEMEERMIRGALATTGGNMKRAADMLGIHRNTLRRKIADYNISGKRLDS